MQTVQTMLKEGLKFGDAVIKDFWKNPFNKSVVVFGGISCLAAPGNPVCIAAVTISLKEIIKSELKVLGYGIIDATNLSKREKDFIKNMLDLVTIRISVGLINPAEGLSDIEAISSGYEFIENAYKLYGNVSDELKGVSFAAQKKGSNEVVIFTIYNGEV